MHCFSVLVWEDAEGDTERAGECSFLQNRFWIVVTRALKFEEWHNFGVFFQLFSGKKNEEEKESHSFLCKSGEPRSF